MRVPNVWRKLWDILSPPKGHPERTRFSLGRRPVPGKKPPKPDKKWEAENQTGLTKDLQQNTELLKEIFHVPESSDVVFREIRCAEPRLDIVVAYVEGMAASTRVVSTVLQPLMLLSSMRNQDEKDKVTYLEKALLPSGQVERKTTFEQCAESMVMGDSIVLVDGSDVALVVETKGWERRMVGEAVSERIVRGPQAGFVEVLRANTGLIRSLVQSPDLVVENIDVGVRVKTKCALLYMAGIANKKLVTECRRRLAGIDTADILSSGQLEQFLEDSHTLLPTILSTERPDRVAHFIMEGMCAVVVAGDPFVLVMPVSFFTFTHSPEDNYVRWPYGNVLRIIRYISLFLTIFLPGLYVAIVNYHPEMVPTSLMMAIAASREPIPFPLSVEVLVMYFGFELIREAGIRIPSPIGPTIGIVGALLVGEAAVSASIVSPILVIVIAVTAVSSFTLPNLEIAMFTRVATLVFIIAGATFGLLGIVALSYVLLIQAFNFNSFGVPFLTPVAPLRQTAGYGLFVAPPWRMSQRPEYLRQQDRRRQGPESRVWDSGETLEPAASGKKGGEAVGRKRKGAEVTSESKPENSVRRQDRGTGQR